MRFIAATILLSFFSVADAAGVSRAIDPRRLEVPLFTAYRNAVLSANGGIGNYILPADRGFRVSSVHTYVSVVSGGGAGNSVLTLTDGTRSCTATMTCEASNASTGVKPFTVTGTCTFPAGALLFMQITTAGCTTTQPTVVMVNVSGYWQ